MSRACRGAAPSCGQTQSGAATVEEVVFKPPSSSRSSSGFWRGLEPSLAEERWTASGFWRRVGSLRAAAWLHERLV
eukprot:3428972-Prymnesium_polylepis.1